MRLRVEGLGSGGLGFRAYCFKVVVLRCFGVFLMFGGGFTGFYGVFCVLKGFLLLMRVAMDYIHGL